MGKCVKCGKFVANGNIHAACSEDLDSLPELTQMIAKAELAAERSLKIIQSRPTYKHWNSSMGSGMLKRIFPDIARRLAVFVGPAILIVIALSMCFTDL